MADSDLPPIIIKKIKKVEGGGHGSSAWKVAYADFVTAMMAFFMLLWLLNVTTDEQKSGIADYFSPTAASSSRSGSGDILGGVSLAVDGSKGSGATQVILELEQVESEQREREMRSQAEEDSFIDAREKLQQAIQDHEELRELAKNLLIDITPEGLRIQLVNQEGQPMFRAGTAELLPIARLLLGEVAVIVAELPNKLAISGHTDASPFGRRDYGNWELSSDRANSSRRALIEAGLGNDRIASVAGKAAADMLFPEKPLLPANRRVSMVLVREAPVLPPGY